MNGITDSSIAGSVVKHTKTIWLFVMMEHPVVSIRFVGLVRLADSLHLHLFGNNRLLERKFLIDMTNDTKMHYVVSTEETDRLSELINTEIGRIGWYLDGESTYPLDEEDYLHALSKVYVALIKMNDCLPASTTHEYVFK